MAQVDTRSSIPPSIEGVTVQVALNLLNVHILVLTMEHEMIDTISTPYTPDLSEDPHCSKICYFRAVLTLVPRGHSLDLCKFSR